MSSHSSQYFDEDFAENLCTKSPKKRPKGNMKGENLQSFSDTLNESDSEEDTDGNESEQDQQNDYSNMTMEELIKLQEDMGTKKFKEKVLEGSGQPSPNTQEETGKRMKRKQFKRANKNRPSEEPITRKAAPRLFSLVPRQKIKKNVTRDPRFDDLSGTLNMKIWKGNYGFLKEKRKKEKEILKKELKAEQNPFKKQRMKSIIQRMENQEREQAKQEKEMEIRKAERGKQIDALRQGKKPKFITKKEEKLLLKAAKYEELKKENRVDKYLERKEKRQRAKELRDQRNM